MWIKQGSVSYASFANLDENHLENAAKLFEGISEVFLILELEFLGEDWPSQGLNSDPLRMKKVKTTSLRLRDNLRTN